MRSELSRVIISVAVYILRPVHALLSVYSIAFLHVHCVCKLTDISRALAIYIYIYIYIYIFFYSAALCS